MEAISHRQKFKKVTRMSTNMLKRYLMGIIIAINFIVNVSCASDNKGFGGIDLLQYDGKTILEIINAIDVPYDSAKVLEDYPLARDKEEYSGPAEVPFRVHGGEFFFNGKVRMTLKIKSFLPDNNYEQQKLLNMIMDREVDCIELRIVGSLNENLAPLKKVIATNSGWIKFDYSQYIGRSVGELVDAIGKEYSYFGFMPDTPDGNNPVVGCRIGYPQDVHFTIHIEDKYKGINDGALFDIDEFMTYKMDYIIIDVGCSTH